MSHQASILNGEKVPLPDILELHHYFEATLKTKGHEIRKKIAIIFENSKLSFEEFNHQSNQLAHFIVQNFNKQSTNNAIAVCMAPSSNLLITLMAILKSGAAYVPLNSSSPVKYISYILQDAQPLLIIADDDQPSMDKLIGELKNNVPLHHFSALIKQSSKLPVDNLHNSEMIVRSHPNKPLACILYTSGSTGLPKGVKLSHQAIFNRLNWQWKIFPYDTSEIGCFKTDLTFVDSISELFSTLLQGITLVVIPKHITQNPDLLIRFLEDHKVTRLVLVPTLLRAILMSFNISSKPSQLANLKYCVCSGELFPVELLKDFFTYFPSNHIISNYYGSTEVMGDVTYEIFRSEEDVKHKIIQNKVPIGKPLYNTTISLLDGELNPVPVGEIGEIFVSGYNLAEGYTIKSDKFLANHLLKQPGHDILYRTGDYGKIINNTLFYEGRTDYLIKIRGHRFDMNSVENSLKKIDGVIDGAVICYSPRSALQSLIAFFVKKNPGITGATVTKELMKSLQPYMIPQIIETNDIPLLVNGKVDREALLKRYKGLYTGKCKIDGQNDIENLLLATVCRVLGIDKVSRNDNFYEIGGNSMNTVQTVLFLKDDGYEITIADFLASKSLKEIASKLKFLTPDSNALIIKTDNVNYKIVPLPEMDRKEGVTCIRDSFFYKGRLEKYLEPPADLEEYYLFIDQFWDQFCKEGNSFGLYRGSEIQGASVNFDFFDEPPSFILPPSIKPIIDYLVYTETATRKRVANTKHTYIHNYLMGVNIKLNYEDSVRAVELLEAENLRMAKANGFKYMITTNVNPLTQQICNHVLGYEVQNIFPFNEWTDDKGNRPYKTAPDDAVGIHVIKTL